MSLQGETKIDLCSDEDIPAAFRAVSKGFGHVAPFFDAYFPQHDTVDGQARGIKRLLEMKRSEEASYFVKAFIQGVDGRSEQIVGLAMWTYMNEAPSAKLEEVENVEEAWPNEDDREYMKRLWKDYVVPRGRAAEESGGKGIYVLELLAVDREYQHKGAGSGLVSWGTKAADERGLEAVIEGTPEGLRCYHNGGFRTEIEEMEFNVGERYMNRKRPILSVLRRPFPEDTL